jgi:hypothetical protein
LFGPESICTYSLDAIERYYYYYYYYYHHHHHHHHHHDRMTSMGQKKLKRI